MSQSESPISLNPSPSLVLYHKWTAFCMCTCCSEKGPFLVWGYLTAWFFLHHPRPHPVLSDPWPQGGDFPPCPSFFGSIALLCSETLSSQCSKAFWVGDHHRLLCYSEFYSKLVWLVFASSMSTLPSLFPFPGVMLSAETRETRDGVLYLPG